MSSPIKISGDSKSSGCQGEVGIDGWDAELMVHLPPGWERLAQRLTLCEEKAGWPNSMKATRPCFIPKAKTEAVHAATDALQVQSD